MIVVFPQHPSIGHPPLRTPRVCDIAVIHAGAVGGNGLVDGLTAAGSFADRWSLDLGGDAAGWVEVSQAGIAPDSRASHEAASRDGAIYLSGGFGNDGALADF